MRYPMYVFGVAIAGAIVGLSMASAEARDTPKECACSMTVDLRGGHFEVCTTDCDGVKNCAIYCTEDQDDEACDSADAIVPPDYGFSGADGCDMASQCTSMDFYGYKTQCGAPNLAH